MATPSSTKILVIEDEPAIARAHGRVLSRLLDGCEITTVNSAALAIAELSSGTSFALILSDFDLIGAGTGGDVLLWVRAQAPATPFLFCSGNEAIEMLGVPYIAKPCFPNELRAAIVAAMGVAS